ncbi:hypothetical protein J437_LFUL016078 [Ladona fulva]|uniref:Uncharacterized protein n=1 Tax=Ladona fulva TaxID=123851 RepID=A0A8K0P847_LADFU|nr:hypothetical protein J437_LFUL016078 [Ladona fulva]
MFGSNSISDSDVELVDDDNSSSGDGGWSSSGDLGESSMVVSMFCCNLEIETKENNLANDENGPAMPFLLVADEVLALFQNVSESYPRKNLEITCFQPQADQSSPMALSVS